MTRLTTLAPRAAQPQGGVNFIGQRGVDDALDAMLDRMDELNAEHARLFGDIRRLAQALDVSFVSPDELDAAIQAFQVLHEALVSLQDEYHDLDRKIADRKQWVADNLDQYE